MSREATFERLVDEHGGEVFRLCRSILRDEHLGADAAQETFLALWRFLADGGKLARTGAFLRRVAVNTCLDVSRRRRVRPEQEDVEETPALAETRGPATRAQGHELHERFERALCDLSFGQRTIFLLRHEGGLSLADVAEILSLSKSTVRTQFARACLGLQARMTHFRPEE